MNSAEYVKIKNEYLSSHLEKEDLKKKIIRYNKRLVRKYPWLKPEEDTYMYTELDRLADGWRAAFGDAICKDINKELRKHNSVDTYKIVDIRAVNGRLLWISEGQSPWCQLDKIFDKYEKIAANTCIVCGKETKDHICNKCK